LRKWVIVVVIVVAIIVGLAIYLMSTTPSAGRRVAAPLSPRQRALLENVSATADSFALIPSAAALDAKLRANPVTSGPLEQWETNQAMPPHWAAGGADLVVWKEQSRTSYALRLDAVRALLVRAYLMLGSDIDARWSGDTLLINAPPSAPIAASTLDTVLALAKGLPPADALAVQLASSRGAYPPIGRPAVTSIAIDASTIVLTSHAEHTGDATAGPLTARFPRGALIATAFTRPPRLIDELNRVFFGEVSTLLGDGGAIAIYDIDPRKFLPRPTGVIVIPATPERRAALAELQKRIAPGAAVGVDVHTAETGNELLLSFDRDSNAAYIKDAFEGPVTWPAATWVARIDPRRLVPVLGKLQDNAGFRIAAPKLYRSAGDLNRWIHYLEHATSIEAAATEDGQFDRLEARISSK
jgi:hypothetical protein